MTAFRNLQFPSAGASWRKGIGTALMEQMIELLKREGCEKASLAVQKDNYAVRMYQKTGFSIIDENEEEYIMMIDLKENE